MKTTAADLAAWAADQDPDLCIGSARTTKDDPLGMAEKISLSPVDAVRKSIDYRSESSSPKDTEMKKPRWMTLNLLFEMLILASFGGAAYLTWGLVGALWMFGGWCLLVIVVDSFKSNLKARQGGFNRTGA